MGDGVNTASKTNAPKAAQAAPPRPAPEVWQYCCTSLLALQRYFSCRHPAVEFLTARLGRGGGYERREIACGREHELVMHLSDQIR